MNTVKKITSIFLALVFLASSLGLTVNKMVCGKRGKTKFSFTALKQCCKEKKSTLPVVRKKCCDITNTSFNLGNYQSSEKVSISNSACHQLFYLDLKTVETKVSALHNENFQYCDLPPPLHGRHLLTFISTFII